MERSDRQRTWTIGLPNGIHRNEAWVALQNGCLLSESPGWTPQPPSVSRDTLKAPSSICIYLRKDTLVPLGIGWTPVSQRILAKIMGLWFCMQIGFVGTPSLWYIVGEERGHFSLTVTEPTVVPGLQVFADGPSAMQLGSYMQFLIRNSFWESINRYKCYAWWFMNVCGLRYF